MNASLIHFDDDGHAPITDREWRSIERSRAATDVEIAAMAVRRGDDLITEDDLRSIPGSGLKIAKILGREGFLTIRAIIAGEVRWSEVADAA